MGGKMKLFKSLDKNYFVPSLVSVIGNAIWFYITIISNPNWLKSLSKIVFLTWLIFIFIMALWFLYIIINRFIKEKWNKHFIQEHLRVDDQGKIQVRQVNQKIEEVPNRWISNDRLIYKNVVWCINDCGPHNKEVIIPPRCVKCDTELKTEIKLQTLHWLDLMEKVKIPGMD
jgi:hypothetical protein